MLSTGVIQFYRLESYHVIDWRDPILSTREISCYRLAGEITCYTILSIGEIQYYRLE